MTLDEVVPHPQYRMCHVDAAALRAWSQPGWIKVAMEFRVEPTAAGTRLSTETRVTATDPRTRRLFAPYWFFTVLVLHPPGQQRDPPRGIESRRRPRGVAANAARPNGERLKHPRKGR